MICDKGGGIVYHGYGWLSFPWNLSVFEGRRVKRVFLDGDGFGDDDLPKMAVFPGLERVLIVDNTRVTDAGIALLKRRIPDCVVERTHFVEASVGGGIEVQVAR